MRRLTMAILLVLALLFSTVSIASAVTDGTPDGNGHPQVVLLVADLAGKPAWRCSATLLSPTVVLTAGHCTSNYPDPEPVSGIRIFTESNVQAGIGITNNYPYGGGKYTLEAQSWATHPLFETAPFYVHDAGIVILKKPGVKLNVYGQLPTANQFDAFDPKKGEPVRFTAVGYGLQQSFPDAASWKEVAYKTRYVAYPELVQINTGFVGDYSLLLTNNANTGGTCFGDSGGPNFLGDTNTVAGITSFGLNSTCGGTGGVFRTDRQDVLDFINAYLNP